MCLVFVVCVVSEYHIGEYHTGQIIFGQIILLVNVIYHIRHGR